MSNSKTFQVKMKRSLLFPVIFPYDLLRAVYSTRRKNGPKIPHEFNKRKKKDLLKVHFQI